MQRLEVSGALRPIYGSLGFKRLIMQRAHIGKCVSGDIAPRILNLGTGWRWAVNFTLRPLYPWGENFQYGGP